MNFLAVDIYCCAVLFLLMNCGESLRCRSGNQQNDDQVHKIMQKCRKKHFGNESNSGKDYSTSNENYSDEEDSESVDSVEEELFFHNNNNNNNNNNHNNNNNNGNSHVGSRANNSRNDGNYGQASNDRENRQNDRRRQDSSDRTYYSNPTNYSSMNDRGNGMSSTNERRNNQNGMQSQNRDNVNDDRRNRSECIGQCFFDELNLVDHKGFPERGPVIEMMTRGVQDPNLRDFIEESISECFHYLNSDMSNRDKCSFSTDLMSCFTDKGKERCEDWDDD